jgi:hypothetical protein
VNDALTSAVPLGPVVKDEQAAAPGQLTLNPETVPDADPKTAEPDE